MHSDSDLIKIPPFMDSHMHFVVDGKAVSRDGLLSIMNNLVRYGVFRVQEMGYKTGIGFEAKKILSENNPPNPLTIRSSGFAIYKKGTYGVFLGKGISERHEIKKTVNDIADAGADFLKVVNSGVVSSKGEGLITPGGFPLEDLKIICDEAKERNLLISCHANGDDAIRNAVIAGVSSIEHGFFISRETIQLMAEKGTSWTPTVFALLTLTSTLPSFERKYIEKVVERHLQSINYADSAGIQLKIGTDSGSKGVKHGESIFDELALFRNAGIAFDKILSYACIGNEEINRGNYLTVTKDFIESRKIQAVYYNHTQINSSFSS